MKIIILTAMLLGVVIAWDSPILPAQKAAKLRVQKPAPKPIIFLETDKDDILQWFSEMCWRSKCVSMSTILDFIAVNGEDR